MTGLSYARAEWRIAWRRPRLFVLNLIVPAGLIALLVFAGAPAFHASIVATVLFAFFGTFGTAIPLVRDLETGRLTRLFQAGASPGWLLAQRTAMSALIDFLQCAGAAALILITHNPAAAPSLLFALLGALLFCSVLGVWIGTLTRSIGEAALLSSIFALLALHAGGVFRTPVPGTFADALQSISPFRVLHDAMRLAFGLPAHSLPVARFILIIACVLASLIVLPAIAHSLIRTPRR